jgi:TolB-like protein
VSPLVEALAKQLVERKRPRVAAVDFTDIQGRPTELGRFLADHISVDMVMAPGITVLDRANLVAIMAEHKLTAAGLVDPETAKKLGKFAGVDAVIVGSLSVMETSVLATVRAISTETAELVAAGRMRFDLTTDARRMLGMSISATAAPLTGGISSSSSDSSPAAVVGPLSVRVKDLRHGFGQEGGHQIPQLTVILELQNRLSNALVGIAANSAVVEDSSYRASPTSGLIFGSLQDSSGKRWVLAPGTLRGLSTVFCFETTAGGGLYDTPYGITQNSPSNIVDYIRRSTEYGGGSLPNRTGRFWGGSFASIEPASSIEIAATFVPAESVQMRPGGVQWQGERGGARRTDSFSWPSEVQLSLELVTATHQPGEAPSKSSDLSLRNVVIPRVPVGAGQPGF